MKIYARVVMVMLLSLFIVCACVNMNNDVDDQQTQDMWNVYEKIRSGSYLYRLKQIDYDGSLEYSDVLHLEVGIPNEFTLYQNFPNPFNPSTIISFSIPERTKVVLTVYDVLGTEVSELINDIKSSGKYEVKFDSKGLPSGIYFYTIQADNFINSKL